MIKRMLKQRLFLKASSSYKTCLSCSNLADLGIPTPSQSAAARTCKRWTLRNWNGLGWGHGMSWLLITVILLQFVVWHELSFCKMVWMLCVWWWWWTSFIIWCWWNMMKCCYKLHKESCGHDSPTAASHCALAASGGQMLPARAARARAASRQLDSRSSANE